jgi:hypothetical protein
MRMTQVQAIAYCHHQAMSALHGSPTENQRSILWNQLCTELERGGLDIVERACVLWRDTQMDPLHHGIVVVPDPRESITWTLYGTFLDALYDEEEIGRAIAGELLPRAQGEIVEDQWVSLRAYYLSCFRGHLVNVRDGSSALGEYEEVRERIEADLRKLEEEYGTWIDEALKAQQ